LKKNRSRWVLRFFRFHPAGIKGSYLDGRYLPKQLYKIRFSSGVSKDKGTASFTLLHGSPVPVTARRTYEAAETNQVGGQTPERLAKMLLLTL
jgi:hypothetical protein